jgi:hypothetical protein
MVLSKPMLRAGLLGAGPAKVESSPAAMATDSSRGKDPVDLV